MNYPNPVTMSHVSEKENKKRKRLLVKKGQKFINLRVEYIPFFFADGKVVFAFDQHGTKYICDDSLSEIEELLDPNVFFRASRKYLVNIDYIKSFQAFERVKLLVELDVRDTRHTIIVSQVTTPLFKRWITSM